MSDSLLSVVIPAHNEDGSIAECVKGIHRVLDQAGIPHEILVVNDHSTDATARVAAGMEKELQVVRCLESSGKAGYGMAVRKGLDEFKGDYVAIVMGDSSDDPEDLVSYYEHIQKGVDCVFGSRFIKGAKIVGYPRHKYVLNRLANRFIKLLFKLDFSDVTNAFKIYSREAIGGMKPFLSCHFNLTVELPLKAIIRGYSYDVIPIRWYNRASGVSKLKIKEMGSRYLFIVLYCWLEKHLSRGDYRRRNPIT